jgi:aspartyl protease
MNGSLKGKTGFLLLVLLCGYSRPGGAARPGTPDLRDTEILTVARLIGKVRKSLGYDALLKLSRGFTVEEAGTDHNTHAGYVYSFGPKGKVRRESTSSHLDPFVFDGEDIWQINQLTGEPLPPAGQRLRERLLLPFWLRSGWWLDEAAPLMITMLPEESNRERAALSITFREELVGPIISARLSVNRSTWLPETLIVTDASDHYTYNFADYRKSRFGFLYPHRIRVEEPGNSSVFEVRKLANIKVTASDPFTRIPLPADTTFDNNLPAELKVAKGADDGHFYVRPLVDGQDLGWFHFDTGFGVNQIDTKLADKLGMPIIGTRTVRGADGTPRTTTIRRGKTFQLGRVTIRNPIYYAEDLSNRNAPPGEKRAGLCGYPFFARVLVEFIHGGGRIALYDPATYKLQSGEWKTFTYVMHVPAIRIRFEGNREGLFIVDTGSSVTIIFNSRYTKERNILDGRDVSERFNQGSGGAYKVLAGKLQWLDLEGYRFESPYAEFRIGGEGFEMEGRSGVIGRPLMGPFVVVFDYRQKRMALVR